MASASSNDTINSKPESRRLSLPFPAGLDPRANRRYDSGLRPCPVLEVRQPTAGPAARGVEIDPPRIVLAGYAMQVLSSIACDFFF